VDQSGTNRVTVEEAARLLGIEKSSVKKRIQRGKLRSEKDTSGTVYVYMDRSETVQDKSQGRSETGRDELLESKNETISILRDQLREEREARRRADTIIAQLTQANASLAAKVPELEASQEAADAPRRSRSPRIGKSPGSLREALRRAHTGPGGVGCSADSRPFARTSQARRSQKFAQPPPTPSGILMCRTDRWRCLVHKNLVIHSRSIMVPLRSRLV
jgi:excisionase family DNA binding protein